MTTIINNITTVNPIWYGNTVRMGYSGSLLYRKVLSPFYDKLVKFIPRSVHPNHITIVGGVCALLASFAAFNDYRWAAATLFTLYHMCDNADGKHARATAQSSEFGAILDHFGMFLTLQPPPMRSFMIIMSSKVVNHRVHMYQSLYTPGYTHSHPHATPLILLSSSNNQIIKSHQIKSHHIKSNHIV